MGEAIAAQVSFSWFSGFLLAQDATGDGLLQGLDACLHLDLGHLPQQPGTGPSQEHRTGHHQLARGLAELRETRLDDGPNRGRQQLALGPLLRHDGRHLYGKLQPPGAIGSQPWHQPFSLAQQFERLQQVQRLPLRLRKQEVAQPDQRPL